MAKDKSKTIVYVTSVLANGKIHHMHFRKEKTRMDFFERAQHLEGVDDVMNAPIIYVYEDADNALNTLANYTSKLKVS